MKTLHSLTILLGLFFGFAINAQAQSMHHHSDPPSVHGMLLFGNEKIYLSHLPMFHSPHDYQVILEAEISEQDREAYLQAKKNKPNETVYTLVPEVFVLPEMVNNPRAFKANIFQGHFERGGTPITGSITVNISKVIYFKKFEPNNTHPETVKYIYFGDVNEIFGAHLISAKPDFDHIVEVGTSPMLLELLSSKPYVEVELTELQKQTPVKAGFSPISFAITESGPIELDIYKIGKKLYLEFGDLSF
ncbi:MAG: hypothetical protein H6625_12440 [Bdellovibrionaceae bacterium]|nr:hypothetical protein [Pseudobdellovibrionaceae bacterium]